MTHIDDPALSPRSTGQTGLTMRWWDEAILAGCPF